MHCSSAKQTANLVNDHGSAVIDALHEAHAKEAEVSFL